MYLLVGVALEWLVSETPYLVHEAAKAPHITGCGVLPVFKGLHAWRNRCWCIIRHYNQLSYLDNADMAS